MSFPIAPGVFDIVPEDLQDPWKSSYLWQYVESVMRDLAAAYGFKEMRTPLLERTELFQRSVGEATDIVSKEMYSFIDRGNRQLSLRPEGTAPAMRAFLSNELHNRASLHKLYYIAPMFRYERAQAGRYRQHHQFGAEVIGGDAPEQDAELIDLLYTLYSRLGLKNLSVNINSLGDPSSRELFRTALHEYLSSHYEQLSADSKRRLEVNPLRILDSKDPQDQEVIAGAPSILSSLSSEGSDHFEAVKKLLTALKIPFVVNHRLVRGLDYYNRTVFEVTANELGAQNSIGGGGRYDGLIKTLGGPDLPSLGFGCGIERLIQTMLKQEVPLPSRQAVALYVIALGDAARTAAFSWVHQWRSEGLSVEMDYSRRKLGKLMHAANQAGARYVAVIGDEELSTGNISLKEMATGTAVPTAIGDVPRMICSSSCSSGICR
jgi:histidyl-tRNA synthetase